MDTMLKNKVVHLSTLHGKTFEIPPIFFQQENCNILLQKELVLLTITFQSSWGKKPHLLLRFLLLYKKVKMVGLPKVTFGLPNLFLSQCFISQNFYKKYYINKKLIGPLWGGSRLVFKEFFPRCCFSCKAFKRAWI